MSQERLRIAVVGAGAFGKNHLRVVRESGQAELAGVFDIDPARRAAAAAEFGCPELPSLAAIASAAQAAIVAVPTTAHAAVACELLEAGLDVLVEKPMAASVDEGRRMADTARAHGRILQVGHLERFNPAVTAAESLLTVPLFFEVHRLSVFSPRSLDVDVVADLMIHDLEIVLAMTGQRPSEVNAAGIQVLSSKVDIANVRLAFPNGCIANLTASRVSTERVRKLRFFQPQQYISVDYAKQELFAVAVENGQVRFLPRTFERREPLKVQFDAFAASVLTREKPKVSGMEGLRSLEVSSAILDKIKEHSAVVAQTLASFGRGGSATE